MYFSTGIQLSNALAALPSEKVGSFIAFDPAFYAQTYMGAYQGTLSPLEHFVQIGADRFYSPNAKFDPVYYANAYADLRGAGLNSADLLFHFMQFGLDEGRAPNATLATFDGAAYLVANPDVAAYVNANLAQFNGSVTNGAIAHYVKFGAVEGRVAPELAITADQTFKLTTGLDDLAGAAGNDTFAAKVVQNGNGEQTNQLATGDSIHGGAGTDTLNATVQAASSLNGLLSAAITPETVDVEVANFTALAATQYGGYGLPGGEVLGADVVINAKNMDGLDKVGSIQSNVDLLIEDLNTLTDSGVYAERRNTKDMTIRFDHGSNDSTNGAADLVALFDNDYLMSDSSSTTTLELRMVNNLTLKNGNNPLKSVESVSFKVGDVTVTTAITADMQALTGTAAYNAVVTAIEAQLTTLGITGVTVSTLPERTTVFSDDVGGFLQGTLAGSYSPILVTSTGGALTKGQTQIDNTTVDFNGLNTQTTQASTAENPIEVGVELLKVGRGGEGGELVIGGMATDLNNNWDYTDNALEEGVQVFNVLMDGDRTQFSSLAGLYSTNNTLETVNVTWAADSRADLIIGNQNTEDNRSVDTSDAPNDADSVNFDGFNSVTTVYNHALKDVRVFNAANNGVTAAVGNTPAVSTDVTLWAHLSDEVVAKYMDRTDIAAPAADNANFAYTFGAGNDTLNLNISQANLAASGTSGREDFSLNINTGAGNDTVVVQIGDGQAETTTPWYVNTAINAINKNLAITTGEGDDVVHANGAGVWDIKTGNGNDAIYSDNSGRQVIEGNNFADVESNAVWVFNTANQTQGTATGVEQNLFDLTSAAAVASVNNVGNLDLTVSFRGINVTVEVGNTHSNNGGTVNDLVINQAIKKAINDDVYLSKLLTAQDGPGRTLIVTAKTDGVFSDADISISVGNSGPLTAAQTAAVPPVALITTAQLTALGLTGGSAVANGRFDSAIAEDNSNTSVILDETATVTWQAFAAVVGGGTQSIGGMVITAADSTAFTAAQVATVAAGGTVAGLTLTTPALGWTVTAGTAAGTSVFTSTSAGTNVTDLAAGAFTGVGNTAPTRVTTQQGGTFVVGESIVGAASEQPNKNVIDAGMGNDVVVLSSSADAAEVVNVATVGGAKETDSDVVFNASAGAKITYDQFDTIITSAGVKVAGGVGTVAITAGGLNGSAGNDIIDARGATVAQAIDGKEGNDTIFASTKGDQITGGLGGDKMTGGAGADTFVIGNLDSGLVIASADEITGFATGSDKLQLGVAGIAGNSNEAGGAVADFTAALAAADTALGGTVVYAFQWDASNGYLFEDTNADGTADQVIVLVGVTGTTFDATTDIIA